MSDSTRTMHAKDVISAKEASCYVTINGERFKLLQAKKLEAKIEKNKREVPILGRTGMGHKTTNWNGKGSMTIYSNTSIFTKLLKQYKDTGEDIYFTMQVRNEDNTSEAFGQTVVLIDVNLDSGTVTSFDADGDWGEQDIDFTFEDFEVPEEFKELDGMR